jgi:hypothetical protein
MLLIAKYATIKSTSIKGLIIAVQLLGQRRKDVLYKREREREKDSRLSIQHFNSIDLRGKELFLLQGNLNALANVHISLTS